MRPVIEVYHVALKILLRKGNKFLFLRESLRKRWDLPGGRIDRNEGKTPFEKIIEREVQEELGPHIRYTIGKLVLQYRRFIGERKVPVFLNVYEGRYISGALLLSSEHTSYHWIEPGKIRLKEKDFLSKEEYLAFKNYFRTFV